VLDVQVLYRVEIKANKAGYQSTWVQEFWRASLCKHPDHFFKAKSRFLWGDPDPDQWSEITRIMVHRTSRWIRDKSGFVGFFDASWSEWSWITDPDPDHPKGTNPKSKGVCVKFWTVASLSSMSRQIFWKCFFLLREGFFFTITPRFFNPV